MPELEDGTEDLHQLTPKRYAEFVFLLRSISNFISDHFQPDQPYLGCIRNIVRQMHIHIVGRPESDPLSPTPSEDAHR